MTQAPSRAEVIEMWERVIEGDMSRANAHTLSVPWVERHELAADPMVGLAMHYFHGFIGVVDPATIATDYANWRDQCRAHDLNPDEWRRRRVDHARQYVEAELARMAAARGEEPAVIPGILGD